MTPLWIGLWAWLFCRPLSEPGQVFGWLGNWLYAVVVDNASLSENVSHPIYKVLIDCPKCHAGQIAFWWQVVTYFRTGSFSIPFVLSSIFIAICFTDLAELIDKWKNT